MKYLNMSDNFCSKFLTKRNVENRLSNSSSIFNNVVSCLTVIFTNISKFLVYKGTEKYVYQTETMVPFWVEIFKRTVHLKDKRTAPLCPLKF